MTFDKHIDRVAIELAATRESSLAKLGIWFYAEITRSIFPRLAQMFEDEKKKIKNRKRKIAAKGDQ